MSGKETKPKQTSGKTTASKTTSKSATSATSATSKVTTKPGIGANTVELDVRALLMPLALIISAVIISVPISLSIYLGLRDAGLGTGAGMSVRAECDPASPLSVSCLTTNAEAIGLNMREFESCLEEARYDSEVTADIEYGTEIGVAGTPSIFLGENRGDELVGFSAGPSIEVADVRTLIDAIEDDGVEAAIQIWRDRQLAELGGYEAQLEEFYAQQGLSGDGLEEAIAQGLAQRELQIDEELQIQTVEFAAGARMGSDDAVAALVEFSDYECPFCQRFAAGPLQQLKNELVDSGELLFVYRDFPLESIHPNARRASNAARCAGEQGEYFAMHDAIFEL